MFSPPCICNIRMLRGRLRRIFRTARSGVRILPGLRPKQRPPRCGGLAMRKGRLRFCAWRPPLFGKAFLHFGHFQRNAYAPTGNDITLFGICHPKKRLALSLFFRHSRQGRPKIYAAPYSKPHPGQQKGAQPKPGPGSNDPGPGTVSDDACSDWISP